MARSVHRTDAIRFLRRALVLGVPFLIFLALLEAGPSRSTDLSAVKRARLDAAALGVETLVLGSSHAHFGVDARLLGDGALNMALPAGDPHAAATVARLAAERCPRLRLALFDVGDLAFTFHSRDVYEAAWFAMRREFGMEYERAADRFDPRAYSRLALYGARAQLLGWFDAPGGLDEQDADAFMQPGSLEAGAITLLAQQAKWARPSNVPDNVAEVVEAIEALRAKGVKSFLVGLPMHASYRLRTPPDLVRANARAIDEVRARTGVTYLDYVGAAGFVDEDFADASHLSAPGAEKFSRLLAARVASEEPERNLAREP